MSLLICVLFYTVFCIGYHVSLDFVHKELKGFQLLKRKISINVRENRRGNQEWTIQRNWQHWVHKTQDEDKQNIETLEKTEVAIKNGQFRETGNVGYIRHRTKTNKTNKR